jgi:osmotically-inducible protein OsmY
VSSWRRSRRRSKDQVAQRPVGVLDVLAEDGQEQSEVPEGVEATAKNGNLTLTGAVKYPSQHAAAESAVAGLTGVRNISNKIDYVFDVDPVDVKRLVREALDSHKVPLDDSHVVVDASGNSVTLIGHVQTEAQRAAVVEAVWRGHAVMAAIDQLEITG